MDFIALRKRTLNDAALMTELLGLFRSEMTAGIARFDALAASQDVQAAGKLAHRLKGSAATIAATSLAGLFVRVESACETDTGESPFALLPQIKAEVARCFAEIDAQSA